MQPTGAAPSPRPPSPALFQPADLFDLSVPISKMAAMAMSTDDAKRAALRSQIVTRTQQQELLGHSAETVNSTLLNGVQRHIDKAILAFDIGGDVEGGLRFLSADSLPTATAFHQLPLTMAIYKTFSHLLTDEWTSLALQQADNGDYHIGGVTFRVVPYGELPGGHRYADGYKRTDPVIRWVTDWLFPSFSAFLLHTLLSLWCGEVDRRRVFDAAVGPYDYGRLLTEGITEDEGIAVDWRYDRSECCESE
ncbi:unnamed protein product [Vitrella brassicaformis CCMP3155]|uniref:Uncharacterized protein n=1 Tax=Vitrella brassicaformis (strain CCMP3155) TaxID=1169540 RepID=A0A0G4EJ07_VITBC|nr:unnamed protein product [Vitrella brassicaformis CCMP3155]|eukprot:CEL96686.1 unnamed protein product [Vitrella brassicaformis CCMP3155]